MRRKGLRFYKKNKMINSAIIHEVLRWIVGLFSVILIAYVLVSNFGVQTSVIGISMEETLYNGERVLVNKFHYNLFQPSRGDIIAFLPNGNKNTYFYIKRVVAIPGDTVQISNGKLYINSEEVSYNYDKIADPGIAINEITLKENEYFVMGDNCNSSEDSRSGNIGLIAKDVIMGKAWFHFGNKESKLGFL
ncbi:MAG: signal peptidase I [Lachnospiraceae bacterium]